MDKETNTASLADGNLCVLEPMPRRLRDDGRGIDQSDREIF